MNIKFTPTVIFWWFIVGFAFLSAVFQPETATVARGAFAIWGLLSVLLTLRWVFSKDWVPRLISWGHKWVKVGVAAAMIAFGIVAITSATASPTDHNTLQNALSSMGRQGVAFPSEKGAGIAFIRESLCLTTQQLKTCVLPLGSEQEVQPMFDALLTNNTALFDARWSRAINAYATEKLAEAEKKATTIVARAENINKIDPGAPWAMIGLAILISLVGAWTGLLFDKAWGGLAALGAITFALVVLQFIVPPSGRIYSDQLVTAGIFIALGMFAIPMIVQIVGLAKGAVSPKKRYQAFAWLTMVTAVSAALSIPVLGVFQLPIISDAVATSKGGITYQEAYLSFNMGFFGGLALISFFQGLVPKVLGRIF